MSKSPLIWVPKIKELIMPVRPTMGFGGFYKLEAVRPDGRIRPLTGWFPNLITNTGLDGIGSGAFPFGGGVAVGSGNSTPAFTDTALNTLVASTTNFFSESTSIQSTSPYFGSTVETWQFPVGAAAGNLSEVGVYNSSPTALFSRALILDGSGNPTTITVLSNEALNVTYQLNQYAPLTDVTGSITMDQAYTYTIRASNVTTAGDWSFDAGHPSATMLPDIFGNTGSGVTAYNGAIGAITGAPAGTTAGASSVNNAAYTNGSYQRSAAPSFDINHGNLSGGIQSVSLQYGNANGGGFYITGRGAFQIGFSPNIPKDNTKVLTLDFTIAWVRGP
jgi:hypothetical protein